ncbi:NADH-quinone oxidoreductase subunit L [Hydrogenimonas urashimensis]|uniref:NADH-quinone oxidoreductase subunit L n=1 Tax=Hydrogenimonas urashimensis TaxID=2740515 RepID=UPI001F29C80C|nr:NADH-quinone oxidoreductase subunit L [Hydrogenimonas urashimensis]
MNPSLSLPILGWILVLPFLGALIIGLLHLAFPRSRSMDGLYALLGISGPILSAMFGAMVLGNMMHAPKGSVFTYTLFQWIAVGRFNIDVTLMADALSAVMLFIVTFVGSLIHIYAVGYMWKERSFGKFFAYFNFFLGSMLLLVLADNPIIMFIGWELVGLASYLLIGWYYEDPANVKAANKAFIVNRVGDFGFISGLGLLFALVGSHGFTFFDIAAHIGDIDIEMVGLVGMLLFIGAMGKSAQIPLFVWLPDAMAGPTPVSALIHAATMVTAGVYMVARFAFMYNMVPDVGVFIASIGAASAILAAVFACYQRDIKKILAYSTMSQLGYMFIGVGLGAYSGGIFHLFTHAFFKALLFMGAGAVIIALHHEQDIFKMGGLRKRMKLVTLTMLIATLAISGIPPFSGFFSKDAILAHAFASHHYLIWTVGVATAYLTAYYMFRLFFVVFVAPAEKNLEPRPLPPTMTWPLVILAAGSALAGFLGVPEAYGGRDGFALFLHLADRPVHVGHLQEMLLDGFNVLVALAGIYVAYVKFVKQAVREEIGAPWQTLLYRTLYIDALYDALFVRPLRGLSRFFDRVVDNRLVDGIIGLGVGGYRLMAGGFALLQNGNVRWYALYIMAGIAGLSLYILQGIGGR